MSEENTDQMSTQKKNSLAVLKVLWTRRPDGKWAIDGLKNMDLRPREGFSDDFFLIRDEMEVLTGKVPANTYNMFSSFGPTTLLLRKSILPVVSWIRGQKVM